GHATRVTVEENAVRGGAGRGVNEFLMAQRKPVAVLKNGLADSYVPQGDQEEIRSDMGLDAEQIQKSIEAYLEKA
ncbi:transketolase C-terminal domain-containing protein, partial [Morganella morganii]|uniref:transketolase C-terminal domain-containing protein n=1 Tax=Morganella morganii TaxID=582 RepID=UPI0019D85352